MIRGLVVFGILGLMILFGWTAWRNVVPNGVFEVSYDFKKESPFITSLSPGDRVVPIKIDVAGIAYQTVIDEPVYFRVRPPRGFTRGIITIRYQNEAHPIVRIGGLVNRAENQFDLKTIENAATGEQFYREENGWRVGGAEFDLTRLETSDGRTYTFVLSVPGIAAAGNAVRVAQISARLERASESFSTVILNAVKNLTKPISNSPASPSAEHAPASLRFGGTGHSAGKRE